MEERLASSTTQTKRKGRRDEEGRICHPLLIEKSDCESKQTILVPDDLKQNNKTTGQQNKKLKKKKRNKRSFCSFRSYLFLFSFSFFSSSLVYLDHSLFCSDNVNNITNHQARGVIARRLQQRIQSREQIGVENLL
jgi:hypothetical protein